MKKLAIILVILLAVLSIFSAVMAEDTVRVGTDAMWPPFEMVDENTKELTGFDVELMQYIADKEGFKVEFVNQAFDSIVPGVGTCQYDAAISAITITDERAKAMSFSDPYFTDGQIVTVKEGNESLNTKDALKGKTIGCQTGTTGAIMAQDWEKEGSVKYKGYETVDLAFFDLKNGQIDAVLSDQTLAKAYTEKLGGMVQVGDLYSSESYGIAVCKTNADLLKKINDGLAQSKADGTWDKLYAKYFSSTETSTATPEAAADSAATTEEATATAAK